MPSSCVWSERRRHLYKLEDFVNIENNLIEEDPNNIISICKRLNNKKRDFLFVNKWQGKHIPTSFEHFQKLSSELTSQIEQKVNLNKNTLLIGFAETATGLSTSIMSNLVKNDFQNKEKGIWYIQTTRRKAPKEYKYLLFSEEHSHATEQKLFYNFFGTEFDNIIIIDDEITTGNTVINLVKVLKEYCVNTKFYTASILNWQNEGNRQKFGENNITSISLINGSINLKVPNISIKIKDDEKLEFNKKYNTSIYSSQLPQFGMNLNTFKEYENNIINKISRIKETDEKTILIGTEECMFPACLAASKIRNSMTQSTTRSPICISDEKNYIMNNKSSFFSNYGNYISYLYNVFEYEYDRLILITDSINKVFLKQIEDFSKEKKIKVFDYIEV